eukprot:scaffold154417_cov49-Prasinocladus_malaysianus.AAC.6
MLWRKRNWSSVTSESAESPSPLKARRLRLDGTACPEAGLVPQLATNERAACIDKHLGDTGSEALPVQAEVASASLPSVLAARAVPVVLFQGMAGGCTGSSLGPTEANSHDNTPFREVRDSAPLVVRPQSSPSETMTTPDPPAARVGQNNSSDIRE